MPKLTHSQGRTRHKTHSVERNEHLYENDSDNIIATYQLESCSVCFGGVFLPSVQRVLTNKIGWFIACLAAISVYWGLIIFPGSNPNIVNINDAYNFKDTDIADLDLVQLPLHHLGISSDKILSFDPRLLPTLWISSISKHIGNGGILDSKYELPFSWGSWKEDRCRLNEIEIYQLLETHLVGKFPWNLTPIDKELPEKLRVCIGKLHLSNQNTAEKVLFLGDPSIAIPIEKSSKYQGILNEDLIRLLKDHIDSNMYNGLGSVNVRYTIKYLMKTLDDAGRAKNQSIHDISGIMFNSNSSLVKEDFLFEIDKEVQKRRMSDNADEKVLFHLEHPIDPEYTPKYFHEALLTESKTGGHYDWRFFQKSDISDYERIAILHRLARTWFRFVESIGVDSWLAHGSLLGWYWNGMSMPWDNDIDVQISMKSLLELADNFNQTIIVDSMEDDMRLATYLLDVGPSFYSRERGNGNNTIDARFIDITSGIYIDITALAVTNAATGVSLKKEESVELLDILDSDYAMKIQSQTAMDGDLYHSLNKARSQMVESGEIVNCRNNHFYNLNDIVPLVATTFEGIRTKVPREYTTILRREYPKGLLNKKFAGYKYLPMLRLWVKKGICKYDVVGNECDDQSVLQEFNMTCNYTYFQQQKKASKSQDELYFESFRVDPWLLEEHKRRDSYR